MMTTRKHKEFNTNWILIPGLAVIITIAIIAFLFSKDGYGNYKEITGWEALKMQWPSFWKWVIGCTLVGVLFAYLAYANEGAKWPAVNWPGHTVVTIAFVILSAGFILGPWGKACTDKTNAGVTAPGYKNSLNINQIDGNNSVTITQGDTSVIVIENIDSQKMKKVIEATKGAKADTTKY